MLYCGWGWSLLRCACFHGETKRLAAKLAHIVRTINLEAGKKSLLKAGRIGSMRALNDIVFLCRYSSAVVEQLTCNQ